LGKQITLQLTSNTLDEIIMKKTYDQISVIIGIIAGVFGIVTCIVAIFLMFEKQPVLALISGILILILVCLVFIYPKIKSYRYIKNGMHKILSELKSQNIRPNVLVAFNRTGAAFAGMIGVNIGVQEIVTICKIRSEEKLASPRGKYKYSLSSIIELNDQRLKEKINILIIFYVIDTARSLEQGLKYLSERGIELENVRIATMFITPGARHRFPNVIYFKESSDSRDALHNLPWVIGDYNFL
jgi:hypoxanthine phosphoribosyltransferase